MSRIKLMLGNRAGLRMGRPAQSKPSPFNKKTRTRRVL
ncbi:hypothetical protein BLL52_2930 [Rhodoferax antarcticus ANT.BR]|uniref:Uncharacterized protein n=1 Tax=Rhodoferax antarcticus ANT.BR TaxID=1111071 RepID=A0A1Q8YFC6_9BURK|nr:hypothetical protein BLL52_2930 [Rhodoferax antarcticus ANT.BR]